MGADEEVNAAVTSAIRQLRMIDACRDVWTEADQSRYIRVLLEDWIDELARADEAQCDFMAECAFLACENMQDARLGILEERVDRAENPPGGGVLGFLAQLGVMRTWTS
ncbi:hypothetical protein [Asanoa iriomotensis]|uniref:Uncharacterized protein n=1 Tax=Asanoa iriomotensis TaxID=234613 RepID=A0ABQ4CCU7_9ACTN|nr:hypothetical protein [Asanoa iriomotensis]GIF60589.1 hypothetical protein Air01nite_66840 [Asanoa iriomotensis]